MTNYQQPSRAKSRGIEPWRPPKCIEAMQQTQNKIEHAHACLIGVVTEHLSQPVIDAADDIASDLADLRAVLSEGK